VQKAGVKFALQINHRCAYAFTSYSYFIFCKLDIWGDILRLYGTFGSLYDMFTS
jgi:hypothetical protein